MTVTIGRRKLLAALGGAAAAWPVAARAQQAPLPVVGFVHLTSRDETRGYLPDFQQGLADAGYIDGKNVTIEYRWGEGHNDRLPGLIAELVRRQVSVIVTLESMQAAQAAKDATHTIPVIFMQGADPVRIGLVDSLSRPGGKSHRHQSFSRRRRRETPRVLARVGPWREVHCLPAQPDEPGVCGVRDQGGG
jgi:putative ABC transport system substrate-binding protein